MAGIETNGHARDQRQRVQTGCTACRPSLGRPAAQVLVSTLPLSRRSYRPGTQDICNRLLLEAKALRHALT